MITAQLCDITQSFAEIIVCNANSLGIMDVGVAKFVRMIAGNNVVKEAKEVCLSGKKLKEGEFFTTGSGNLAESGIKKIYHAVLSDLPGGFVSLYSVEKSINSILKDVIKNKAETIAIPNIAIDSGIDGVSVAIVMSKVVLDYCDKISIKFVGLDKEFIDKLNSCLLTKGIENVSSKIK